MRYPVPQNIFMPDRIIGPLTLAQFLYLLVSGILALLVWFIFSKASILLTIVLILPIVALGLGLAFIKINNRPFHIFLLNGYAFFAKPRQRIWLKTPEIPYTPAVTAPVKQEVKTAPKNTKVPAKSISDLASIIDTQGWSTLKTESSVLSSLDLEDLPQGGPATTEAVIKPAPEE